MGRKLEHIEKIDRAIGRKKLLQLLPAFSVIVCRDGLLYVGIKLQVIPYQDMVWVYRRNKRYLTIISRNGIRSDLLLTYKLPAAAGPRIDGESVLVMLRQSMPWCFFDKTKENRKLYRSNFKQMVKMADARRGQLSGGTGI